MKLSFRHNTVISSLSKLNIKSESFFYKCCQFLYAILECGIDSAHFAVNWSNSSHFVTFWTKHQNLFSFFFWKSYKMWQLKCHIVKQQSFCHFLKKSSNQKTSFLIVVQFGMLLKEITEKVKVKLSFCYKSVILSLPKPNIESKNFFYKSC